MQITQILTIAMATAFLSVSTAQAVWYNPIHWVTSCKNAKFDRDAYQFSSYRARLPVKGKMFVQDAYTGKMIKVANMDVDHFIPLEYINRNCWLY